MTKKKEIELARAYFNEVMNYLENADDTIYEFVDPECRYENLCDKLNFETEREVIALGFKQKYGVEWHQPKEESWKRGKFK